MKCQTYYCQKGIYWAFFYLSFFFICSLGQAQEKARSKKKFFARSHADAIKTDTTKSVETAALDIGQNRGLFIATEDEKMQMRILGSVRYLIVYDDLNLPSKNSFNTYEIPTGDLNEKIPNYYNDLDQSRLGFEVTRKTPNGDIFIRLETDFAGESGFRIRHAYGQFSRYLFGQTWSLFSHVNALPAMVDFAGPTGSVIIRTPQIRYSVPKAYRDINLAVGLEYIIPDLKIPDSLLVESFQVIPDITVRLDKEYKWGQAQLSAVVPMLSGRDAKGDLILKPGWGVSASAIVNSWKDGKWYAQGVIGQAISRYFNDLSGNGLDILFDSELKAYVPLNYGFYGTYEHDWRADLSSNFTLGFVHVEKFSFTPDNAYLEGYSMKVNTFWNIIEGAKIGGELIWGQRVDKNDLHGDAFRLNFLVYYDF